MKNLFFNLGASFVTFFITALISFWMTPFIITNIGTEAYGFIPLTQNIISILTILTLSLSSVIARFITIEITKDNIRGAQEYFNTYLIASFFGSIFIMLIVVTLIINLEKLINIPTNFIIEVKLAVFLSGIMIILSLFKSLFFSAAFSQNRIYLNKSIDVLNAVIKGLMTYLLLVIFTPKIWYVNLSAMVSTLITLVLSIYIFKKLMPIIKIKLEQFSFTRLKELLNAGMWIAVGQIGVVLFLAVEILIANITLGPLEAGIYAAMIQFPLLLRNIANSISVVFAPVIINRYANNNQKGLLNYSNKSVKINGLLIVLPATILCGFAEPILNLWLGKEFLDYKWILIISSSYLIFTLSPLPLVHVFTAVNKLKIPGITTIIFGLINFSIAYSLSAFTSLGLYGIVIGGAVGLILKNTIFTPIYCSRITNQSYLVYFKGMIEPIVGGVFIIFICIILQKLVNINNWIILILMIITISITYIIFVFVLLLSKNEKNIIITTCKRFLKIK
ncbi:MATE family efflux transporter [Gracilibacillus dipsosauri]|uniref:Polysaccharide biosynthesis protein C-terminal domain-containing protein n=1 Tax=Gracilibacillus dipsosauri TaxID=178340 RepID=A0A317KUN3_9BACI|nr:MATE family efflux transporter [Gracilibacillus dipsosauri]PWU67177.1 hypothetical protein DLJ74_16510 [Gracilibacillus dipsosauri]